MRSWLRSPAVLTAIRWAAVLSLLAGFALPSAAEARWPDGVLNYCGFDGYWDEAGWRDLRWAEGGTAGVRFDRDLRRFGKASLRIEGASDATRAVLQLPGNAVQPGKQYVLRVWVKTQDIVDEAALTLQPHAEGEPLPFVDLGEHASLQGTHDWTLLEVPVPSLPARTVRIFPYLQVKGAGTAWFDEFALTELGVQVPWGGQRPVTDADYAGVRFADADLPGNLLPNSGFEEDLNGWFVESGEPQIDRRISAVGQHSLRYDGFPECHFSVVQVRVKIDPRRACRLSLKLKTDLRAGLSCVQLLPLNAKGEALGYFGQDHTQEFCYGRGVQDWHETSVVLRQFQPETDALNVYLLLQDAVGTVWFDEIRLSPCSLAETETERMRQP
ncbi:MAG: carbohydrate binding domain-containing protein [Pirellulaceae bacterium]